MRVLLTVAALAALALVVLWGRSATAVAGQRPSLTVHASPYGRILFDGHGYALYAFTRDSARRSKCSGACAQRWPPYIVARAPNAGLGVAASRIGTIPRNDGSLQATYAGKPLYRYVGDHRPLQVLCQNVREFGGLWLVVGPNGAVVP
jgi:predicted lipoprotein with Yx(FWY)xxD motif